MPQFQNKNGARNDLFECLLGFLVAESFHHPIQRPAVDMENFCGPAHISVAAIDDVADVLAFNFFQRNKVPGKQSRTRFLRGHDIRRNPRR